MKSTTKPLITVDSNLADALWANFVAPVMTGAEGLVQEVRLGPVERLASLFPIGSVDADLRLGNQDMAAASGRDWSAIAVCWTFRPGVGVFVRAATEEALGKAIAMVRANAPAPPGDSSRVDVDFWQAGSGGVYTTGRAIEVPVWDDLVENYPSEVASSVGDLAGSSPDADAGRVVLWHGPPGTGKTTAIRALARSWRDWARFQVLLDAEAILGSAATLMHVLLDDDDVAEWRVLVIEDADAIVRADAPGSSGASTTLSRLLNVGDGIVGQGTKVLVLLTTNEKPERLHPALGRPGRCLSSIWFRRFSRAEAAQLVDGPLPAGDDFSLAELKGRTADEPAVPRPAASVGQYL